jgi:hypothetical protein
MGAASVSIRRLCVAREARSAFRAGGVTGRLVSITGEARTGLVLGFHGRQGGIGLATLRRFLDRVALHSGLLDLQVGKGLRLDRELLGNAVALCLPSSAARSLEIGDVLKVTCSK